MFNVDLIDPNWQWDTQRRICDETLDACAKYGVKIFSSFGGNNNHQHYIGHYDKEARREAVKFFKSAVRQTAYLGGKSFGTCFAIMTVRCDKAPELRKSIMENAFESYAQIAEYAAETGLEALAYEMTSISRESCATFEENDYVLERCSKMAVPMRICLDMGHRNNRGKNGEHDHLEWIRRYVDACDVIDCQQTDLSASCHWPFTEEYNKKGIIRGGEIVEAINKHSKTERDILLAFELRSPAFYPQEDSHLDILRASVDYWRNYVLL